MYKLSHEEGGDISFLSLKGRCHNCFVTSESSKRGTKYDIVPQAIKLILPSPECDNHILVLSSGKSRALHVLWGKFFSLESLKYDIALDFREYLIEFWQ